MRKKAEGGHIPPYRPGDTENTVGAIELSPGAVWCSRSGCDWTFEGGDLFRALNAHLAAEHGTPLKRRENGGLFVALARWLRIGTGRRP